jgi:hypothetical protein
LLRSIGLYFLSQRFLRPGLLILAAGYLVVGLWALIDPQSFYEDFPGFGDPWIPPLGPYNEHLISDIGGLNSALGVLLLLAAKSLDRRLVEASLIASLVYSVPHLIFHLFHNDELEGDDAVAQTIALAFGMGLSAGLLFGVSRGRLSL